MGVTTNDYEFYYYLIDNDLLEFSERGLASMLDRSKSDIQRCRRIAMLGKSVLLLAEKNRVEKYVLYQVSAYAKPKIKKMLIGKICTGEIITRKQLSEYVELKR